MSPVYAAYSLTISTPFTCPTLTPLRGIERPSLVVREASVPQHLSRAEVRDSAWDAAPGLFLYRGGVRGGRWLVEHGDVLFEPNAQADQAVLARQFAERILPAVLSQRGFMVLHASAVASKAGVVVIGGESGAGKSTTLAGLIARGCRMVSDDVTAVRASHLQGRVEVVPGAPQAHLTADAAVGLGYALDPTEFQPTRRMKATISTRDSMAAGPGLMLGFYLLTTSRRDRVEAQELCGAMKLAFLQDSLYGPALSADQLSNFRLVETIVTSVPFVRVDRPATRWSLREVTDLIMSGIAEFS